MECARAWELLGELVLGALPADVAREVKAHCDQCPACRDEYQALAGTLRLAQGAGEAPMPEERVERVLQPARRALRRSVRARRLQRVLAGSVAAAAALLLALWPRPQSTHTPGGADCRCWRFVHGDPGNARRAEVSEMQVAASALWTQGVQGTPGAFKPLGRDDLIVVGSGAAPRAWRGGGELLAFDAATGRLRWRRTFDSGDFFKAKEFPDRCIVGERLYVTDGAQCLVLDLASGVDVAALAPPAGARGWSYLTADGRTLYGASRDGRMLFALDRESGRTIWARELDGRTFVPALSGGVLFAHLEEGAVVALEAKTAKEIWRREVPGVVGRSSAHARRGSVYVVSQWDEVVALRASDGATRWRHHVQGAYASGLALGDDAIYTQGGAVALAMTDGRVLRHPAGPVSGVCSSATVAGGHVLAPGGERAGSLSVLSATGAVTARLDDIAHRACDGAIVSNGRIYLVGGERLVALAALTAG